MPPQKSQNIYIQSSGNIYKFINTKLEPNDGSFYITLQRDGSNSETTTYNSRDKDLKTITHEKPRKKKVRISYHSSGCVLYRHTEIKANYFEPITKISNVNLVAAWSIPSISTLDSVENVREEDLVVSIEPSDARIEFSIILAPWNQEINEPHLAVRYEGFFCFIVVFTQPAMTIPPDLEKHFITMAPEKGSYKCQQIKNDQALIDFHQKINNTRELIIYSPNNEGIYKLITQVPMVRAPDVKIQFIDSNCKAEIISCKKHVIKFKVKNIHGHTVKEELGIISITLDSEI